MKKNEINYKKFYRLFLSYFLVFLIPTVVVSSAVFKISDDILREEIKTNQIMSVQTAQHNLSKTIESFSVVASTAAYTSFGQPINLEKEVSMSMQLIGFLNKTTLSYLFLQDIFIIYESGDYIYSGQTSFTRDNFYSYLDFRDVTQEEAREYFRQLDAPGFLRISGISGSMSEFERKKEYILCGIPCTRKEFTAGVMAFLIDVDKLNLFLGNGGEDSYTFLVDQTGAVLNEREAFLKELQEFQKTQIKQDLSYYYVDNHTYVYGSIIPGYLNMVSISTSEKSLARLNQFRDMMLSALFLVFLLGMVCVLFAYLRNRRDLIKVASYYEQEIKKVLPAKQKELLYTLIEGRFLYQNDLLIQSEQCMMDFSAQFHYCILVTMKSKQHSAEEILSGITKDGAEYSYLYYVSKVKETCVYLAGTREMFPMEAGAMAVEEATVFVSRPTTNLLHLHLSYAETLSLMYMGGNQPEEAAEEDHKEEAIRQHHYDRMIKRISACASTSDAEGLKKWKEELSRDLKENESSFSNKRKLLLQLYITVADAFTPPFSIDDILQLESHEEIDGAFQTLFLACEASLDTTKSNNGTSLEVDRIKEYIQQNYTDPMFSLQVLADYFQVSNSYLSWFFKQKNGNTVLDFTTQLKMNRATQLLTQGYSLQDVSLQVGYINVSSFIRRFKQTMGMTPGEYKKKKK